MRNKKPDPNRKKIVFSKKRLRLIILLTALVFLFLYLSRALDVRYKYIRQFCAFFGYVSIILDVYHMGKLFTKEIRQELYRRLSKAIFNVAEKLKAAADVEVVGLMVSLNRMEVGKGGVKCAQDEISERYGFPVASIVTMAEVTNALEGTVITPDIKTALDAYYDQYGVK